MFGRNQHNIVKLNWIILQLKTKTGEGRQNHTPAPSLINCYMSGDCCPWWESPARGRGRSQGRSSCQGSWAIWFYTLVKAFALFLPSRRETGAKVRCGDPGEEVSPAGGGCWLLLSLPPRGHICLELSWLWDCLQALQETTYSYHPLPCLAGKVTRQLKTGEMRRSLWLVPEVPLSATLFNSYFFPRGDLRISNCSVMVKAFLRGHFM